MGFRNLHSLSWYHWHSTNMIDFSTNIYVIYKFNIGMVPLNIDKQQVNWFSWKVLVSTLAALTKVWADC